MDKETLERLESIFDEILSCGSPCGGCIEASEAGLEIIKTHQKENE